MSFKTPSPFNPRLRKSTPLLLLAAPQVRSIIPAHYIHKLRQPASKHSRKLFEAHNLPTSHQASVLSPPSPPTSMGIIISNSKENFAPFPTLFFFFPCFFSQVSVEQSWVLQSFADFLLPRPFATQLLPPSSSVGPSHLLLNLMMHSKKKTRQQNCLSMVYFFYNSNCPQLKKHKF